MIVFKKPPLLASSMAVMGLFILLSLGTWQANKYFSKTSNLASDACNREKAALVNAQYMKINENHALVHCRNKMALQGRLNNDITIALGPRVNDGKSGYHIYKPMIGLDYTQILVNFGWSEAKDLDLRSSKYTIIGSALKPNGGNYFTPENKPDNNEWYALDLQQIADLYDLKKLSPYVFFANTIKPNDISEAFVPAEMSKSYLSPKMHFQYAIFWYLMALTLLVIFVLRFAADIKKAD